ncbi:MAG TPA: hypothetical protein VI248_25095 [Kineosporiaceae bacterium]
MPDPQPAADVVRLYWFWPERGRLSTLLGDEAVWRSYRRAATAAGLELDVISVDDVDVLAHPDAPVAYVRGAAVDPARAAFHAKLYTWPPFASDVWRSLATFQTLAPAGYFNLIRPELNLITNDKAATLLHLRTVDDGWLTTLSMPTRDLDVLRVSLAEVGLGYPLVVKPANWASGNGVSMVHTEEDLFTTVRLAGAAELTVVVQPLIGSGASGPPDDVRVYCVEGAAVGALRRTPPTGRLVANITAGGRGELVDVPAPLRRRAEAVARYLDTPWLGVDFLGTDGTYWLSEVEIDACVGPVTSRLPGMAEVLAQRFAAYRARFDRWLATEASATGDRPTVVGARG